MRVPHPPGSNRAGPPAGTRRSTPPSTTTAPPATISISDSSVPRLGRIPEMRYARVREVAPAGSDLVRALAPADPAARGEDWATVVASARAEAAARPPGTAGPPPAVTTPRPRP